jgi:hypothetical protein
VSIPIQNLTFHCRWTSEAKLPDYVGSTLRGAFGWALKRSTCMLKREKCPTCILNTSCAYAILFATERYETVEQEGAVNARPHPLVFQPSQERTEVEQEGKHWHFSLLVVGRAIEFLPHVIYSVRMMGETGVGMDSKRGLGRFVLNKVTAGSVVVYDVTTGHIGHAATKTLFLSVAEDKTQRIRVCLRTPLRLKQKNRLQTDLPFHVLIRAVLRRISALENAYGQGEPDLDYRGLVHRAKEVRIEESTLHWQDLLRYSNRQQQKVSLSGLTGTVIYVGELGEFVPLLDYAQQVHIGKQTLFGLGRLAIDAAEPWKTK